MIKSVLRASASVLATGVMLSSGAAYASPSDSTTVVDGANATGTIYVSGINSVGTSSTQTIYTNYTTEGGAGSGGGGGLGGVFFVDQGATLTLNNVSFKSNVAKGGEGGSLPQVRLGELVISLPSLKVDADPINIVGITPQISVTSNGVFLTGATMSGTNGLLGSGAAVSFEGALGNGSIQTIDGTSVTFAEPIAVNQSAIRAVSIDNGVYTVPVFNGATQTGTTVVPPAAGATTIRVSNAFTGSELRAGMAVYGTGIAAGTTIASVSYDANNRVNSITLSQATTDTVTGFQVVGVSDFTAARIAVTGSNTIRPVGQLTGFQVGMEVTGNGIPTGTRITSIAGDGTLTLSNAVSGSVTGFTAVTQGAAVGSNVISLGSARSDLAVGMAVTGAGIPDGTRILSISGNRITLSNAVTSAAASAIANNTFAASFGKVISSTGTTLTLASVDGLAVGTILSGTGVPANAKITAINPITKVVTYVIDNAAAAMTVGGSMNGRVSTGTVGTIGSNGRNGSMYNAVLHDGEGSPGTNGYAGGDGTNAAGGTGGAGGNGSAGLPYNADAILGLSSSIFGAVSDTAGLVADWADFSFARAAVDTGKVVHAWIDVGIAAADLAVWNVDLTNGVVGLGGDGGAGGAGGNGATFFGGGAGGAGGAGGNGALSYTDGGAGGDGGTGGAGGFGAGGGSGGAAGEGGSTGAALDGAAGDGGAAGFGGGQGSSGDGTGGGGGSGYGGAIFVRAGGTLTLTGNALFENNSVYAGSSNNGGEAGQSAGTDMFIMRGSNITLAPGNGNVIRFEGSIADDSAASIDGAAWASGNGANIQITGGGLVQFAGENTYSGQTRIGGATLEADLGVGIHADSRVVFNGVSTIGASLSNLTAGVLLTSGDITNRVGLLAGQFSWTGSGGFAAGDDGLNLNFGMITPTTGQTLVWNRNGFVTTGSTLLFGSDFGTGVVTLENNVNLDARLGRIAVYDNAAVDTDYAVMAGEFTNGALEVNDSGYAGALYFTNENSLSALTVRNGLVSTGLDEETGRLMDAANGGALTVTRGTVQLHSAERLQAVNIASQGLLHAFAEVTTGNIANAGAVIVDGEASTGSIQNAGVMSFAAATSTGNIANSGLLTFAALSDTGTISNSGNIAFGADARTLSINNTGTLLASGALDVDGSFANADLASIVGRTTISGNVSNSGQLQLLGGGDMAHVVNDGDIKFGTDSSVASLLNRDGARIYLNGLLSADGDVTNMDGGAIVLAGDLTTGGRFTNDGMLVVVGDVDDDGVETAATRRVTTRGFQDPTGVVNLGGLQDVANTLVVEQSGDSLYEGIIVGPGALVKEGEGYLQLTGQNSFTGGFAINAGGVDTTGGGTLADTLDVTVASGASFSVGTSDEVRSITNAGTLLATSDLIVTSLINSGAATLNADFGVRGDLSNTQTGEIHLAADHDAVVAGDVTNHGAFSAAGNLVVAGTVSNAADATMILTSAGSAEFGRLVNAGAISADAGLVVTGAYVQNDGSLSAGGDVFVGSLSGTGGAIAIGSNVLTVNQTVNGRYAGAITGSGSVVKLGAATLTLAGEAGSFAPSSLDIEEGVVAVDGANILDSALTVSVSSGAGLTLVTGNQTIHNLTGSGLLALNGNNLYLAQGGNFAGTVSGSGNVQVTSGTFNLANTINSTAGNFDVRPDSEMNIASTGTLNAPTVAVAGSLNVLGTVNATTTNVTGVLHLGNGNGTEAGDLVSTTTNVNGGGTLSGVGTVSGSISIGGTSAGTLNPGNSPGTINVANLAFGNLSTAVMEIQGSAAGDYDRVNVAGTLSLGAGSSLVIANSNAFELSLGQKVAIFGVQPGAVRGQFGSVTSAFGNAVAYNLSTGSVVGLGTLGTTFEATAAATANDRAMLDQLRMSSNGGVSQYYGGRLVEHLTSALATGGTTATSAVFAKASPEVYAGLSDHVKVSMLDNRLKLGGYADVDQPTYFMTGSFETGSARNNKEAGYARYKSTDSRFNIGVAAQYAFGMAQISYSRANGHLNGDLLRGKIEGDQFAAGISLPFAFDGGLRFQARVAQGDYEADGTRLTNAGTAKFSNVDGSATIYGGGLEYLHTGKRLSVDATIEVLGVRTKIAEFAETGAEALENLGVHAQKSEFAMVASNVELGYQVSDKARTFLSVSLDQDLTNGLQDVTANVNLEAADFTVATPGLLSTRVKVGLGTSVNLGNNVMWTIESSVGNTSSYGAKTGIRFRF